MIQNTKRSSKSSLKAESGNKSKKSASDFIAVFLEFHIMEGSEKQYRNISLLSPIQKQAFGAALLKSNLH